MIWKNTQSIRPTAKLPKIGHASLKVNGHANDLLAQDRPMTYLPKVDVSPTVPAGLGNNAVGLMEPSGHGYSVMEP